MIGLTLAATVSASAAAFTWYVGPMLARRVSERRLRQRCAETRSLVLTYDDGPGASLTPRLLDLLRARDARATFFLAGFRAAKHPRIVDEIAAAGHEIACHSQRHLNAWRAWPWRGVADIDAGYQTLARWVPKDGMFRPPHGKMTLATWAAVHRRQAPIGWWTIAAGDVARRLPDSNLPVEQARRVGGGVVLLHDFDREPERADFVLQSTARLLDAAQQERWTIRTLGELMCNGTKNAA